MSPSFDRTGNFPRPKGHPGNQLEKVASMIKNERQYRITKAQADKFAQSIHATKAAPKTDPHPVLRKAQMDAIQSQLTDLQRELEEYEALRSGSRKIAALDSLEEISITLIQARIAAGLSQEDLAVKLGLKPQQIQRYEATDYQSASLARVNEILRVLGVNLRRPAELRLSS
jgi:ribosome-binding protein aMBF1 (putative translation factor)